MNPWIGKAVFLVGLVVCVAIRIPHEDYVAVYLPAPNVSHAAIWPAFRPV